MTQAPFQLFPALDSATEAALRASIERFGVLVPVARDQHGNTLDGHQRSRIADELGVKYRVDVHHVADEDEAREIARTLNADRRMLTVEQRREVVAALRSEGHSLRAIAGAVGVSKSQVADDLSELSSGVQLPDRVRGLDGKSRPARRTVVAAKNPAEAERAQTALSQLDAPPASVMDVKRIERVAREQEAAAARAADFKPTEAATDVWVFHGDLSVLGSEDLTGGIVISDPPYPREFLPAWVALVERSLAWGCEALVLMTGQTILPDVLHLTLSARDHDADEYMRDSGDDRWHYRWCGAYLTPGPATRVWNAEVGTAWKPILVFDRGGARRFLTSDLFISSGDDKRHHHWGQSEEGIARLVEAFTQPGDLVVDPFLGGGTTAVVCRDLGRQFIGCDIDAAAVNATLKRLAA